MGNEPVRVVQISDIHLSEDHESELLGVPTEKSFDAVCELIKQNDEKPDFIILTGDLSQDGEMVAYKRLAVRLKSFNVPAYWVPGNHDNSRIMMQVFPLESLSNHKHIILKNWHFILLNTQIPEQTEGHLDTSQLNYLRHCLQTYPEHNAIIVMHHHPILMGSKWLDKLGLNNADEFWQLVANYHHVHSVIFGHVHQESEQKQGSVTCYSTPSTCIQFIPNKATFGLDNKNPGYRYFHLYEDGTIKSGVKRTKEYIGTYKKEATGY